MKKIRFSLIASAILILSSFMPVIQLVALYMNSWVIHFFVGDISLLWKNGIASVIVLLLFYFSRSVATKLLSLVGVLLFFVPFLFWLTENMINIEKFYFLQFLFINLLVGAVIIVIDAEKID